MKIKGQLQRTIEHITQKFTLRYILEYLAISENLYKEKYGADARKMAMKEMSASIEIYNYYFGKEYGEITNKIYSTNKNKTIDFMDLEEKNGNQFKLKI